MPHRELEVVAGGPHWQGVLLNCGPVPWLSDGQDNPNPLVSADDSLAAGESRCLHTLLTEFSGHG